MSLRAISAELATQGFLNENGRPLAAASVSRCWIDYTKRASKIVRVLR
jgi:hypothetical protein